MIRNYTELQTAVGNWLNRTDLTARIPEFIQLAEAKIARELRQREVRETITLSAGDTTPLPGDCDVLTSIRLDVGISSREYPIKIGTMEQLNETRRTYGAVASWPVVAAVVGTSLVFAPALVEEMDAEVVYTDKLVPLSAQNTTNAVLTEAPDIYLYGALSEAAPYLEHDERIPVWEGRFDKHMARYNTARDRERFTASLRPARLPVSF